MDSRTTVWTEAKGQRGKRIGVSGAMGGTSAGLLFRGTGRDRRCCLGGREGFAVDFCGPRETDRWLASRLERRIVPSSETGSGGPCERVRIQTSVWRNENRGCQCVGCYVRYRNRHA